VSNTPVTICNADPAIALGKLNRLGLLADLYTEVLLPAPVYHEAIVQGALRGEPDARREQILEEYFHVLLIFFCLKSDKNGLQV
jgi:hypothetical protein